MTGLSEKDRPVMKTLSSGALRYLQLALSLLFFLGLPSSPPAAAAGTGLDDYKDDADVLSLPLRSEAVQLSRTEAMSLLAGVCGPHHVQVSKKGIPYCDQATGYPDKDFVRCGLKIQGVLRGHFTSPRADEAVADYLGGCEAHVNDSGGSILLRKEDGIWRRIAYFRGDRAARCLVFPRRDGLDALVCANASSGQGEYGANLELRSLKASGKPKDLLDVHSQDGTAPCEHFSAGEKQIHTRFQSWERHPAEGEPERLVVRIEREDFVTPGFCGRLEDIGKLDEAKSEALSDRFEAFRAKHRHVETVTFDWNGERFVRAK
jgi:hypothetical protein